MSYSDYAFSAQDDAPVRFFRFFWGDGALQRNFYYTNANADITLGGVTYTSTSIFMDGSIKTTSSTDRKTTEVALPITSAMAQIYAYAPPSAVVVVEVREQQVEDPDQELRLIWVGRVATFARKNPAIVFSCESWASVTSKLGLRATYDRLCIHRVFRPGCNLDEADYLVSGTVASVSGTTYIVSAAATKPNPYFKGGSLVVSGQRRQIVSHTGDTLVLNRPIAEVSTGDAVSLYPGCDKQKSTCVDRYDNLINRLAWEYIPTVGLFEGNSVV